MSLGSQGLGFRAQDPRWGSNGETGAGPVKETGNEAMVSRFGSDGLGLKDFAANVLALKTWCAGLGTRNEVRF